MDPIKNGDVIPASYVSLPEGITILLKSVVCGPILWIFFHHRHPNQQARHGCGERSHLPVTYIFGTRGLVTRYLIYWLAKVRQRFQIYGELEDQGIFILNDVFKV